MKNYIGKIIGGICGYLLMGNFFGAILGIFVGNFFDKALYSHTKNPFKSGNSAEQKAFFNTTFLVMGHIAKADGRVSENEINIARQIMLSLGLDKEKRKEAIIFFNLGKDSNFDLDAALEKFKRTCPFDRGLMSSFIEIQIQAAYADGFIHPKTKRILQYIAKELGLGQINFILYDMLFGLRTNRKYQQQQQQWNQKSNYQEKNNYSSINRAYAILGINQDKTDAEVKKAYKRMMSQNHPDKLIAKGLPEEMIKVATEKTQKIQKAYEQICKLRGMK